MDSDFLGHREPNSSVNTKQFMPGRKVLSPSDAKKMNRLYSVESDLSITGGVADHRLRLSSSEIEGFSALILIKLLELSGEKNSKLLKQLTLLSQGMDKHDKWATESAKDLFEKPKQSVVVAGSHLPSSVHLLTYKINQVLGNQSTCLEYLKVDHVAGNLSSLCESLKKEEIETIIFLGGNPVYHCPSVNWVDLLKSANNKYRFAKIILSSISTVYTKTFLQMPIFTT